MLEVNGRSGGVDLSNVDNLAVDLLDALTVDKCDIPGAMESPFMGKQAVVDECNVPGAMECPFLGNKIIGRNSCSKLQSVRSL